ncbi:MAG: sulfite reductase subunit alpha [Pseudomonadota bacterium]|nr:sulfite reductase subunit alpha [Pseudomonadota bacterium]
MNAMSADPARWGIALLLLCAYGALCVALLRGRRGAPAGAREADWIVAYASQTGSGEYLARQTAATLRTGGLAVRSASLDTLDQAALQGSRRILFIASTYGEGDAPDSGARFARMLATTTLALGELRFAVLALGDATYAHYCGFGRALEQALLAHGAQPLFERIDVDRGAAAAIEAWQHQLSHLAGTSDAPDWSGPAYASWRIVDRTLLNAGSAGAAVYRIRLAPADGALPEWEAGDLAQLCAPAEPDRPREYSIASTMAEGALELLVRLHARDDGSVGAASGWLCLQAGAHDTIALRVRAHPHFRLGQNGARPLILIGNGTGIAGLRAHLTSRVAQGAARNWLLFGERNAAHDFHYEADLAAWRDGGQLERLDLAFSRDAGAPRYVQHALAQREDLLRDWVAQGAAIYVCGSLQGMATGVHAALTAALGEAQLEALAADGRYRRDVY